MKTSKLSDKDKVEIRAAYAEGGVTHRELALRYNCAQKTIQRLLANTPKEEKEALSKQIHEANAANMIDHIRNRNLQAMGLFDQILDSLQGKIANASPRELFGGLKILSEVFAPQSQNNGDGSGEAVRVNVIFGDTSTPPPKVETEEEPNE